MNMSIIARVFLWRRAIVHVDGSIPRETDRDAEPAARARAMAAAGAPFAPVGDHPRPLAIIRARRSEKTASRSRHGAFFFAIARAGNNG
jgi:hypothetical protein